MKHLLFGLLLLASGNIEFGDLSEEYPASFHGILQKASWRIAQQAPQRPYHLKKWNDALSEMGQAIEGMMEGAKTSEVLKHLKKSRKDDPKNSFALLLKAVVHETQGHSASANRALENFLLESRKYSDFEETFLRWADFHKLRRMVFNLLEDRGISFEGRERDIQVVVPYYEFIQYLMNPKREDAVMNVAFVVIILGGGVLLILASLRGVDFSEGVAGSLLSVYMVIWLSYGLWIFDLAFGLPFGWSRFYVIPIFLGGTSITLIICEMVSAWQDKHRPLEAGYKRCSKCGAAVPKLMVECSECRAII